MRIRKGPNHRWRSEVPKARRAARHTADRRTRSNRRGTDPYARWCGRGGAVRLPPIPISAKYNAAEKGARNHAAKGCESVEVPSVSLHLAITFATDFVLQLNGWAT